MSVKLSGLCLNAKLNVSLPGLLSKSEIKLKAKIEAKCREDMIQAYNLDKRKRRGDTWNEFDRLWNDAALDENDFMLSSPHSDGQGRADYILTDFILPNQSEQCNDKGAVFEFCNSDIATQSRKDDTPADQLLVRSIDA